MIGGLVSEVGKVTCVIVEAMVSDDSTVVVAAVVATVVAVVVVNFGEGGLVAGASVLVGPFVGVGGWVLCVIVPGIGGGGWSATVCSVKTRGTGSSPMTVVVRSLDPANAVGLGEFNGTSGDDGKGLVGVGTTGSWSTDLVSPTSKDSASLPGRAADVCGFVSASTGGSNASSVGAT